MNMNLAAQPSFSRWARTSFLLILALCFTAEFCGAREEARQSEKNKAKPAESKKPKSDGEDADDDSLLKSLGLGKNQGTSGKNALDEAVRGMRSAQRRIETDDTGKETRAIQEQVVKDLEEVIERLKKRQQQSQQNPSPSEQPQSPDDSPSGEQKQPQPGKESQRQPQPQNSSKQQPSPSQANSEKERDKAQDSSERLLDRARQKPKAGDRDQLKNDVWGHLPPSVRQELLNVYSEKFLPQYEELIQRYYEALAERNKRQAP